MAESRAGQVSFGWNVEPTEDASPSRKPTTPRRMTSKVSGAAPAMAQRQPVPANGGQAQLPPDNELWDVHAAARFLRRSVSWVYHKAEDGTLPVTRLGGWGLRFIPGDLRAWVASGAPRRR